MRLDGNNLAFGVRYDSIDFSYQKFVRRITYDKEKISYCVDPGEPI